MSSGTSSGCSSNNDFDVLDKALFMKKAWCSCKRCRRSSDSCLISYCKIIYDAERGSLRTERNKISDESFQFNDQYLLKLVEILDVLVQESPKEVQEKVKAIWDIHTIISKRELEIKSKEDKKREERNDMVNKWLDSWRKAILDVASSNADARRERSEKTSDKVEKDVKVSLDSNNNNDDDGVDMKEKDREKKEEEKRKEIEKRIILENKIKDDRRKNATFKALLGKTITLEDAAMDLQWEQDFDYNREYSDAIKELFRCETHKRLLREPQGRKMCPECKCTFPDKSYVNKYGIEFNEIDQHIFKDHTIKQWSPYGTSLSGDLKAISVVYAIQRYTQVAETKNLELMNHDFEPDFEPDFKLNLSVERENNLEVYVRENIKTKEWYIAEENHIPGEMGVY